MENDALNIILDRLDNIDSSINQLSDVQQEMKKDIKGLREDVDTIYTVQKEDHNILQKQEKTLNIHTERLNQLIALAEENKEEHLEFDKRISRLEALIS